MRLKMHVEEIRHLFQEHTDAMLRIFACWPASYQHEEGKPLPEAFEEDILSILFESVQDYHEWRKPLDRRVVQSGRPDEMPPDAPQTRLGRPFRLQKRFVVPDPTVPQPNESLRLNRDYPEDTLHQELSEDE